jgi:hypothetical protein
VVRRDHIQKGVTLLLNGTVPVNKTITVENVDLESLHQQYLILLKIQENPTLSTKEDDALEGIINLIEAILDNN